MKNVYTWAKVWDTSNEMGFPKGLQKRVQEKQSRSENGMIVVRAFGPDRKRKCRYILGKFSQCQLFRGCFPQREPVKIKCIGQKRWMVTMCQICSAFTACQIDRGKGTVLTSAISQISHSLVKTLDKGLLLLQKTCWWLLHHTKSMS